MTARVWHGFTLPSNAGKHAEYLQNELLRTYRGLSGNRGALLLARSQVGCAEFLGISLRDSAHVLKAFVGSNDITQAVYFPEDRSYLQFAEPKVTHTRRRTKSA
jgi:hypothetical protein